MKFSERTQVFMIASYYKHLTEQFGERGKAAFIHGVKHYGMQRGSRMAQRVIRAGEALDYGAFCRYGEWTVSEEAVAAGTASKTEMVSISPDYEYHVTVCPWFLAFQEFGAQKAGALYCAYLDEAINQGFNGGIQFHTVQTKHQGDCCIFRVENAGLTPETSREKHMEYVKSYEYHCAHVYYAFGEITAAVFETEGEQLCRRVLEDVAAAFGQEAAQILTAYGTTNFNCC